MKVKHCTLTVGLFGLAAIMNLASGAVWPWSWRAMPPRAFAVSNEPLGLVPNNGWAG